MTTPNGTPILPTTNESQLLTINTAAQAPLKLTSSNYLSWKIQFETLFIGYDLLGYIDGSKPCPPKTLTTNNVDTLNPAYTLWIRQDQLILNALIGSLSPTIISFIARANTSREAWTILANTYAKPSRGRIKQVKNLLKNPSKGTMTVTDFLHSVRARTDELAILGAPMEEEDLTEKILDGLGDEYKELVRAVQARDTSISFDELHEKLLSFEASLLANTKSEVNLPITANPTNRNNPMNTNWRPHKTNTNWRPNHSNSPGNTGWRPSATFPTRPPMATHSGTPSRTNRPPPRPYQGFCQICGIQGHTAKRCPSFQLVPVQSSTTSATPPANFATPWQPRAHYAANTTTNNPSWLLDSGASHHVTTDLNNLSLHAPYTGSDDVMIGDGTGLLISHTGSASLPSSTTTFTLNDVLYDLRTGVILLTGNTKDGVYEWPAAQLASSPILAFSHVKTTSSNWHHRLGEYMVLKDYLSLHGISHFTTPPHTPEHNGYSERRHRHIVETGLTLLSHASLPNTFWPHAFATAVYLINRLPTTTLNLFSPFELIFHKSPNYFRLKVFGCLCYPWLRPYTTHKLTPRSKPCVFLGYSLSQSAYLCLDPSTSKLYVSHHVQFVESVFPYTSLHTTLPRPNSTTISTWIPPILSVSTPPSSQQEAITPSAASSQGLPLFETTSPPAAPFPHQASSAPQPSPQPSLTTTEPPIPVPPPTQHRMTTRAKNNITKPIQKLNLHTHKPTFQTTTPTSISQALKDQNWRQAMSEEYDALVRNGTWELVPPEDITNLVGCKWIFRIKRNSDGSIDRYKARLVAKGFHQRPGVDYHETFSPVVKPTTVRLVLSIAVSNGWSLRQLDVNNAFLQGRLSENVFMAQPPGFVDSDHPSYVCKLHKAIYGLKQAPRAWYHELRQFLLTSGFKNSHSDTSLFVLRSSNHVVYLLVYVDDIILTGSSDTLVSQFVDYLAQRFSLKDLGPLSYFLGVEVVPHRLGILLSQRRYIQDLLIRTNMADAKPVLTPLPTSSTAISLTSGTPLSDPTPYRAAVGSLQYLSLTRPDISFAVNRMAQFMHQPTSEHWVLVKRILRYLCGTLDKGLLLYRDSSIPLHGFSDSLHAFSDADWAGNKDDYSSTSAYLVYLGQNLVSWRSKKQQTVARSSTEAEYRSVAATAAELCWVGSLLSDLGINFTTSPVVYCDNVGATQLSSNPIFHSRMKHVAIDYHFIRDQVQSGLLRVAHVSSADQLADLLTKPLPTSQFLLLRDKIGLSTRGLS
ncbi:Retrovirus-related Pol polyprotein from transposon RE1 [Vitis vinifera]|uniref:Retrovirus-related Pol polyprotein from transposon RE1 n=1 Tax=Vitis vinifera TaxID=29760 RepID=A0A438HVS0_VITVI|nr:Retrovirus-related Pol polyprotein from transposon RE1 [Vitis vinifera]